MRLRTVFRDILPDGSVHHVKFGIDEEVFNALASRDDGMSLTSDDY